MKTKIFAAIVCAAAVGLTSLAVTSADAQTQTQKKRVAAKKYGPVPTSMAPPRTRITVQRRTFLDAGTHVIPGDRKFTDYAIPPAYSPVGVISNLPVVNSTALPGPFTLPGRDNPYPWNYCVGC